jgi:quercetin dioxygenase-like cupin family protein
MDPDTFKISLLQKGLPEPIVIERGPGQMGEHTHAFEANALILEGSITLTIGNQSTQYNVGDVFHLMPQVMHSESYGPNGVKYLVSRKEAHN